MRLWVFLTFLLVGGPYHNVFSQISAPQLLWSYGGCTSWCETGWYSSPGFANFGSAGGLVIAARYTIYALNPTNGSVVWKAPSGYDSSNPSASPVGRTWPGVIIADLNNDGTLEIATGHSSGYIGVYNGATGLKYNSNWPKQIVTSGEFRSLSAADLDGDGVMELIAGRGYGADINTWVLSSSTGSIWAGWPQRNSSSAGYSWGIYNSNIGIANIAGDCRLEIISPSDVHYIAAYYENGTPVLASPTYIRNGNQRVWGEVGAYIDYAYELQGYGPCGAGEPNTTRGNFADGAVSIADMNGDGINEIVAVGNVYVCNTDPYTNIYIGPYIFNADRTRFVGSASANWTDLPVFGNSAKPPPNGENYNVIENAQFNPVAADLDGDGAKEVLYPSYDCQLHVFWLGKTEKHNWPVNFCGWTGGPAPSTLVFPAEPAVVDFNNDGKAEVVVTTWTQKGSNMYGQLVILDYQGNILQQVDLPVPMSGSGIDWGGSLAAPTVANIDDDPNMEILVNTATAGVAAYRVPNSASARLLWATGRANYNRTGFAGAGSFGCGVSGGSPSPSPSPPPNSPPSSPPSSPPNSPPSSPPSPTSTGTNANTASTTGSSSQSLSDAATLLRGQAMIVLVAMLVFLVL